MNTLTLEIVNETLLQQLSFSEEEIDWDIVRKLWLLKSKFENTEETLCEIS